MTKFFIALAAATIAALAVVALLLPQKPSFSYQTLILLSFSTGLIYVYLYRAARPDFFITLYLGSMAIKLLAYGAYVFLIVTEDPAGAMDNVVLFMVVYFVFTALEVGFLYAKISRG